MEKVEELVEKKNFPKQLISFLKETKDYSTLISSFLKTTKYLKQNEKSFSTCQYHCREYLQRDLLIGDNIKIRAYRDTTCCGITHFGAIEFLEYGVDLEEDLQILKEELDSFIYLTLLDKYISAATRFYFDKNLTIIKMLKICLEKTAKEDSKLIIRSTAAVNKDNISYVINHSNAQKKYTLDNLQYFFKDYLDKSLLFKLTNTFNNINSNNTVYEYNTDLNFKDCINDIIEILKT